MNFPTDTYSAIADVSATPASLTDPALLEAQRVLADLRRHVDAAAARIAAEIAHRSRRELGYDGLAQRLGARTPELLVQQVTGATAREAQTLVRVGSSLAPSDPATVPAWLRAVSAAVVSGRLSLDAADAIRAGLGTPSESVSADSLITVADALIALAASLPVERLAARARQLRDELDSAGVAQREQHLRDQRYLRLTQQGDGMTRLSGLLDPESAAIVVASFDAATSPRRGGPRFVDPTEAARADELVADERTTEQIALDAFVELIRIGTLADGGTILGKRKPSVSVHVTARDLKARSGAAHIDGQASAMSIATAERFVCEVGIVSIFFDPQNQVVNVGRNERLFTYRQRVALIARDGGCLFPGCERSPEWCEAHHIDEWQHGGRTDLARGVLLCRHHHMLVHNNGWKVILENGEYAVVPPASIDPSRTPIPAPSKSPLTRREVAAAS